MGGTGKRATTTKKNEKKKRKKEHCVINYNRNMAAIGETIPQSELETQLGILTLHEYCFGCTTVLMTFDMAYIGIAVTEMGVLCRMTEEFEVT